jgi:protein-S-isoprenylcysteine O-methyltransferase Ste14
VQVDVNVVFAFGLAVLFVLGAIVGKLLARDYRRRRGTSIRTVALVWALTSLHFGLVVLAAIESTWHLNVPAKPALAGGVALAAVGAVVWVGAVYAFRSFKRLNFLDDTWLVTEGLYRWSRNPQLVGWTLVLVGLGLLRRSAMVLLLDSVLLGPER